MLTPLQVPGRAQDLLIDCKQEGQNNLPEAEVEEKYISVSIHNQLDILV